MIRDVAQYFRDEGAAIVAFQWVQQDVLFLAVAPALAISPDQVGTSQHLTYARFHHIRNRAEVDAFLRYLASLPAPHKVMKLKSHGRRDQRDGSTSEHMELVLPNTDVAITFECTAADVTH